MEARAVQGVVGYLLSLSPLLLLLRLSASYPQCFVITITTLYFRKNAIYVRIVNVIESAYAATTSAQYSGNARRRKLQRRCFATK